MSGPLQVVAFGFLLEPLGYLCFVVLQAQGRARALVRFALALLPFSWAGSIVGVWCHSVPMVVGAWGIVNCSGAVVLLVLVWRSLGLGPWFLRMVLSPLLGAAIMGACVRVVLRLTHLTGTRTGLVVGIAVGVMAYAAYAIMCLRAPVGRVLGLVARALRRSATA
jgi:hypothetical protein